MDPASEDYAIPAPRLPRGTAAALGAAAGAGAVTPGGATPIDLTALLAARGAQHGEFHDHAHVTQGLKGVMVNSPNWNKLSAIQKEALEMNAHKIGRILAGNPDHADHWDDIAGYARLVADRVR